MSMSSTFSRILSTLAVNLLNVEESISSVESNRLLSKNKIKPTIQSGEDLEHKVPSGLSFSNTFLFFCFFFTLLAAEERENTRATSVISESSVRLSSTEYLIETLSWGSQSVKYFVLPSHGQNKSTESCSLRSNHHSGLVVDCRRTTRPSSIRADDLSFPRAPTSCRDFSCIFFSLLKNKQKKKTYIRFK